MSFIMLQMSQRSTFRFNKIGRLFVTKTIDCTYNYNKPIQHNNEKIENYLWVRGKPNID